MRKNSPRKWLHACLDFLPLVVIPVFMIYSHRHTLTERTEVDIQYKYQSNVVNNLNDLVVGNIYTLDFSDLDILSYQVDTEFYLDIIACTNVECDGVDNFVFYSSVEPESYCGLDFTSSGISFYIFSQPYEIDTITLYETIFVYTQGVDEFLYHFNVLPSYTDFNVIESVEVQDTNENIMSVFTKDLSNTIDNYFNMNQVFNLNDVWNWINTNLFNGNAPLMAKSIWNIIVYEFVIDLLFVFYSFFMFLIDFTECLLDKPFNKGR